MEPTRQQSDSWAAILVTAAGLFFLRDILIPFAIAVILWSAIDSLTHAIDKHIGLRPRWLSQLAAIGIVIAVAALIAVVVVDSVAKFAMRADAYQTRVDSLFVQVHSLARLGGAPPTIQQIFASIDLRGAIAAAAEATTGLVSYLGLTLLFLFFMFSAAVGATQKLDVIFPQLPARQRARQVITEIQRSIRSYLLIQTIASFVTSALTWAMLSLIGLDDALYWAIVIFFLNFVPVIGPIVAVILPTAFALMQFSSIEPVIATALSIGIWPFLFGNFVLPRMAGRSLNLSPLVVLFALALWSMLWGLVGAFLATPLSVMIMIVLAQFPSTRPIAVLMSSDGQPHVYPSDEPSKGPQVR